MHAVATAVTITWSNYAILSLRHIGNWVRNTATSAQSMTLTLWSFFNGPIEAPEVAEYVFALDLMPIGPTTMIPTALMLEVTYHIRIVTFAQLSPLQVVR